MSTLTKVLIILQVVVVLVLCGLVVTYVATADNYKTMYDAKNTEAKRNEQKRNEAEQELEKAKAAGDQQIAEFRQNAAKLTERITALTSELSATKLQGEGLIQERNNMAAAVQTTTKNAEQQTQLFEKAQEQIEALRAEQVKKDSQLKEVNDSIAEKMGVLAAQAELIKRLTDEKTELQGKIEQLLHQSGKAVPPPTPTSGPVTGQTGATAVQSNLKAAITKVDLENKLAEISIGSAQGVRAEMKFYVVRDNQFVCNLLILEVEAQKAVGILDLVQQAPKVGDTVSTEL